VRVPRVTDGRRLEWFDAFGPKALTGIGALPQTLASRSIRFRMRRRRRDEPVERFRRKRALADAVPLRDEFAAWADDGVIDRLANVDPPLPDALSDRQQDACEILVAIADEAGGKWPERVRAALVRVFAEAREAESAESYGTLVLGDLRDAFDELGDRLATMPLLERLNALDERPWGGWRDGNGLHARTLSHLLRPYDVRPTTVVLADGTRAKGYKREDCEDAFARYLAAQS
jgi:Protein of unknown function (DUF3631)